MPTNIRIIHAHDFIVAAPEGMLDLEKSKELLIEVASATVPLGDYGILVDTRRTQMEIPVVGLWQLAVELAKLHMAFSRKTAVLCPSEHFDHAAFFALCAQNRGFKVNAFTSFEDAIEWLSASGD